MSRKYAPMRMDEPLATSTRRKMQSDADGRRLFLVGTLGPLGVKTRTRKRWEAAQARGLCVIEEILDKTEVTLTGRGWAYLKDNGESWTNDK